MNEKPGYILELLDITKRFPHSQFCLDKISFALPYGSIMGFVGENGAGKTTTIGCILNTLKKDSGFARVFGKELSKDTTDLKEKIGVVYDAGNFSGSLTPKHLAKIMNGIYKQWDHTIYHHYIEAFKLPLKQKIATFSKGMTMKLSLAVALSHTPHLLILDEVTSGLDPIVRDDILNVFLDFVQDGLHSIFISSHITSDLEKIADYITFIHHGKVLLSTAKEVLLSQYGILRCTQSQFDQMDKKNALAYSRAQCQIDVLLSDKDTLRKELKDQLLDRVTIDDILLLLVKGGHHDERAAS